jgi:hypothetical protein
MAPHAIAVPSIRRRVALGLTLAVAALGAALPAAHAASGAQQAFTEQQRAALSCGHLGTVCDAAVSTKAKAKVKGSKVRSSSCRPASRKARARKGSGRGRVCGARIEGRIQARAAIG